MSELFSIRNKGIKKAYIKRIGLLGIIFLSSITTFIAGSTSVLWASSAAITLPVSKGGTGVNAFAGGQALIGNGASAIQTKAIDTNPAANSTNLITSGAVQNVKTFASYGTGFYNTYREFAMPPTLDVLSDVLVILGETPTKASYSVEATNFFGNYYFIRNGSIGTYSTFNELRLDIGMGYNNLVSEKTVQATQFGQGGAHSNSHVEIGKFEFNSVSYIGIRTYSLAKMFMQGTGYLQGYYKGSLKTECTSSEDICLGKIVNYADVVNYSRIWPTV
ncbi:MAG: hypothetical protein LBT91_00715 [Bifidobacteriaceae bacterium]|jgi:hypothetical protein|nr:hypothetical protein [Bifidobacteriaceae bacterium]